MSEAYQQTGLFFVGNFTLVLLTLGNVNRKGNFLMILAVPKSSLVMVGLRDSGYIRMHVFVNSSAPIKFL